MDSSRHEGEPPAVEELAAHVAVDAASALRRDLEPLADEVRREARDAAKEAAALGATGVLGLLALQMALQGVSETLGRHVKKSTGSFVVSAVLFAAAACTAAFARRIRPAAPGRRLFERFARALHASAA